jgi:hypothetical protein
VCSQNNTAEISVAGQRLNECYTVDKNTRPLLGSGFGCHGIAGVRSRMEPLKAVHMKSFQSEIQTARSEIRESSRGLRIEDSVVEMLPSND